MPPFLSTSATSSSSVTSRRFSRAEALHARRGARRAARRGRRGRAARARSGSSRCPLFLPSTIPRSAPTSSDAYGSIAGGSWNCAATAPDSRVKRSSPVTAFQGGERRARAAPARARESARACVRVEARRDPVERLERERDLDEVGVPGPLAHAVDRPLHPGRAGLDGGDRRGRARARSRRGRASGRGPRSSRSTTSPTRNAAASGVAIPSVSTTTTSCGARLDRGLVRAVGRTRGRRATSRRRRTRRGCPCSAANETALADPLEHRLARDAERGELAVGDRALDHGRRDAELDERVDVGLHGAREAPDLGVEPGVDDRARSPRSRRPRRAGSPASIRSTPAASSARAISSFSSGESTTPTVCSPSRSVVS